MGQSASGRSAVPVAALSPKAQLYAEQVAARRRNFAAAISELPIAVLIWGPSETSTSEASNARQLLRTQLIGRGHVAHFSEELIDPMSPLSIRAQQLTHVGAYDIVFSIPDSPGSIAEIHDFAMMPEFSHKIVAFLNQSHDSGYANQSLIQVQSTVTSSIVLYNPAALPDCILDEAESLIRRLQEAHYMFGRRV